MCWAALLAAGLACEVRTWFSKHKGGGKGKGFGKDGWGQEDGAKNRSRKVCFAYTKNKGCSRLLTSARGAVVSTPITSGLR